MPPIRTLLWIGPGCDLAHFEITDAPTLDVVWVDGVEALHALPPLALDAAVIGTLGVDAALQVLASRARSHPDVPVLAIVDEARTPHVDRLKAAGVHTVLPLALATGPADVTHSHEPGPDDATRFRDALEAMLRRGDAAGGPTRARPRTPRAHAGPALVGTSLALQRAEQAIASAAGCQATVLVQGETGSGKEIAARRIHAQSARHAGPFVAVNCAAFADSLLASELFGHRRGAFTGADRDRTGVFERAQGGTLFLDEIGETSAALQASLLRVLQEREVLPVGGERARPIDVRVVAATHRDLAAEIASGRFREDLYYRLAVLRIDLPPLRERPGDVRMLAEHFLETLGERCGRPGCRLSPRALRMLERHAWPGNVRELENEIQRMLALAVPGELITARRLSPSLRDEAPGRAAAGSRSTATCRLDAHENLQQALDRIESELIRDALDAHDGRKARTARRLGVTREGLYKKLKRLGIG